MLDLDGAGRARVATGIGFLDHLLALLAFHGGLDLDVVGVILMLAGAVGLALTFLVFGRRDRAVVAPVDRVVEPGVVTEQRVVRERRY